MPRLGSCRTISTNGSEVTTRNGRIKAAGVSASRRCKHSLTPSPLRGKKRSLPDHHQQRTGHLQKGTVCKIKYKLLQIWIDCQIEPRGSVLQSGQQQHLHSIEADRAKPQRFAHGLFHLVLVKILHQPQHLDELAPSRGPHPGFHEPPQPMTQSASRQLSRGAAWSSALVFCSNNAR